VTKDPGLRPISTSYRPRSCAIAREDRRDRHHRRERLRHGDRFRPRTRWQAGGHAGGFSVVCGALSFGAGVASVFGSGGLSTPASLAAIGGGLDLIGLAMIDSCMS
jgi:hypothetical protein